MRPHFDLTLTMVGIVALLAFGLHRGQHPSPTKPVRIATVQAGVPQLQKFDPQFTGEVFERFRRLSEIALAANPPPDLLVWPESSMPDPVRDQNTESYRFVTDFSAAMKTDLMLGTLDVEDSHDYNAALLVSHSDQRVQIYRKIHLVPFGVKCDAQAIPTETAEEPTARPLVRDPRGRRHKCDEQISPRSDECRRSN
ncbi:MAG: hypothetical protein DMF29_05875 [Verrucomicrobia bacterium]|nr:MAG: hypothetical protein DMF29_05875 [Verrucomicrobiota bacterium]